MLSFRVSNFVEVESTNEWVRKWIAEGEPEGLVCRAQVQTGGYGRQGRLWTSPEGGLYQSMLLRPTCSIANLPTLGFVVALAIRAALLRLSGLPEDAVSVKWPNDLLVGDDKIAGISMEARAGGVCVGMGINVFRPQVDPMADERYSPAFFADLAIGHTEVGAIAFADGEPFANRQDAIAAVGDAVLEAFADCYPVWLESGIAPFLKEYESCNYLMGKRIRMQLLNGDVIVEGKAVGIAEDGCLLVDDGVQVRPVNSGEAHILR